jgi:predicted dehydrogenase
MSKRRGFLKNLGGVLAGAAIAPSFENYTIKNVKNLQSNLKVSSNDKINIALIGSGIIGHYDTDTALKVEGVHLTAVCDLYDGRLIRAKEKWGNHLFTTKDYREILQRSDVDAVLICTPDHWHQKISIDAMRAGKHVYCEKPMIQKISEGMLLVNTQSETGKVFQVGSQRASSVAILEAKKVFESGILGELCYIDAFCDRSEARGAWQYSIPLDASPQTVDFDTFLGTAPKVPFSAERFFRWRNYKEYGTGAAGDLIVHLLTTIHVVTSSLGPEKIFSIAQLKHWKDGRDAYDLVNAIMEYPKTDTHPAFQVVSRVNLADGGGKGAFGVTLVGTEGVMNIGWNDFKISTLKRHNAPGFGGYDSFDSFSAQQQEDFKKWYKEKYGDAKTGYTLNEETQYNAPKGYDDRLDHFINFFNSIRNNDKVVEDVKFGLRAAAPSIACNLSAEIKSPVIWDPVKMILG